MMMKRICIITNDDWNTFSGGISRFVREIAPRLSHQYNVTVIVTTCQKEKKVSSINSNLRVVNLPGFRIPKTVIEVPGFSKNIKKYLEESDLVFIQTLENTYPLYLTKRLKKPLILYFHGLDWEIFVRSLGLAKLKFLFSPLVKKFWGYWYRKANHVCLPSLSYVKYLKESKICAPYTLVPLGVDVDSFVPPVNKTVAKKDLGFDPTHLHLGFVGRFWPDKNIEFLLEVFSKLHQKNPRLRLLIIGRGYKKYEKMIQNHPGTLWVGYQGNVIPYLQAMDIYCQPLLPTETSSLTTMEAMSCGLPVVVNAVSCPKEYIQHEKNGFLVNPPNDLQLFVSRVQALIDDPSLRERISRDARQTIVQRFSWDQTANLLGDLFEKQLEPLAS